MPATPTYGLRYPASTDPADVPADMQRNATDVETALGLMQPVSAKGQPSGYVPLDSAGNVPLAAAAQIKWSTDTNLFRNGARQLATNGGIAAFQTGGVVPFIAWSSGSSQIAYAVIQPGDTFERLRILGDGTLGWSPGSGVSTPDVTAYRTTNQGTAELWVSPGIRTPFLRIQHGVDLAISGATLSLASGFHRITGAAEVTCTTIYGSYIGQVAIIQNQSGSTLTFNTSSNIGKAFSLAQLQCVTLYYCAINNMWYPLAIY